MKLFKVLAVSCTAAAMLAASACKSDKPAGDPEMFRVENDLRPQKTVKEIKTADMLYKIETDRDALYFRTNIIGSKHFVAYLYNAAKAVRIHTHA